jgi:hypothetical protein
MTKVGETEQTYRATIRGKKPLLQHRFNVETNMGDKPKRGAARPSADAEAEASLYKNGDDVICEPSSHIEGALITASKDMILKGRRSFRDTFKAGITVEPEMIPLSNQAWKTDSRMVVMPTTRGHVVRSRPRFENWELTFDITVTDPNINEGILGEALKSAGRYIGIGDFRPKFGTFEVTSFKRR